MDRRLDAWSLLTLRVLSRRLNWPVKKRSFLNIVGVDLGGGKSKNTAVATLRVDAHACATVVELQPRSGARPLYDAALTETLRSFGDGSLICIDAPLTLPPCLRCQEPVCPGQAECVDPAVIDMRRRASQATEGSRDGRRGKPLVTPYTQRPTEVHLLHERGLVLREALGQGTGPLAARATHLVRALADRFRLNENLIEVSPQATLSALGFDADYKKHVSARETRARVLEDLSADLRFGPGIWRESCVQNDHLFEAVICAYTGYLWARDGWSEDAAASHAAACAGWIWVPPQAATSAIPRVSAKR
jgi:hypothetical protein